MNYDSTKPYCGFNNVNDLRADLEQAFQDAIVIPNEMLPAEYQNHKEAPTISEINKKYAQFNGEAREQTEAQKEKAERTRRIENMTAQYAADESFEYDEDQDRLYRNMVAFCSAAQLIDQDDIDDANFFGDE